MVLGRRYEACAQAVEMLRLGWEGFRRQDSAPLTAAGHVHPRTTADAEAEETAALAGVLAAVGRLHTQTIAMIAGAVPFTDRAVRETNTLYERAIELLECVRDAIVTDNRVLIRHVLEHGKQFGNLVSDFALAHQQRLEEGVCMPRASEIYLAMLEAFTDAETHARRIAEDLAQRRL